jgi:hypothetical protein
VVARVLLPLREYRQRLPATPIYKVQQFAAHAAEWKLRLPERRRDLIGLHATLGINANAGVGSTASGGARSSSLLSPHIHTGFEFGSTFCMCVFFVCIKLKNIDSPAGNLGALSWNLFVIINL